MTSPAPRKGRRITEHPLVTPEKLAEIRTVREVEEAYFNSPAGQEELSQRKAATDERLKQHGGARPGAGRPKTGNRKPTVSFVVTEETKQFLQSQNNTSAYLEALIRRSTAFRHWLKQQGEVANKE